MPDRPSPQKTETRGRWRVVCDGFRNPYCAFAGYRVAASMDDARSYGCPRCGSGVMARLARGGTS